VFDPTTLTRFGNLHLLLLHLPIGFAVAAVALEGWLWRRPTAEGARLQGALLALNAVAALLTAGFGLLLAANGSYPDDELALHRWAGVACAAAAVGAWWAHAHTAGRDPSARRTAVRGAVALLFAATVTAGHLGATLTHGPEVTAWWAPRTLPPDPVVPGTRFAEEIHPVLRQHCYECHGASRAKGRLRLDRQDAARAGGRSGLTAIAPGAPEASEILRRIALPRTDNRAMPPGDRPALTPAEFAILEAWIAAGAPWQ
jgi:mono/diheme cytochrome c family protein